MSDGALPLVALVVRELRKASDRVGRTHIHKTIYLAQTWLQFPEQHQFSLYLHGPYSRDLDGEIQALEAVGIVSAQRDPSGYGARYDADETYAEYAKSQTGLDEGRLAGLAIVAQELAPMPVRQLEALATAEFVRRSDPAPVDEEVVSAVLELKPHLRRDEVQSALRQVVELSDRVLKSTGARR